MKYRNLLTIMLLSALMFSVWAGSSTVANEVTVNQLPSTVKIGLLTPLTGGLQSLGPTFKDAAELAIKDMNAAQSDVTFELVVQDTKTTQSGAQDAMTALATAGVAGVIGAAASSSTLAALSIAKSNNIPMISYASTSPALTTADDNGLLFRVVPSDSFQGKAGADLADELGLKRVAIIGISDAYGQGLTGAFADAFTAKGSDYKIVKNLAYDQETQTEFSALITQIKDADPDGVFMVSFVEDGKAIISELFNQGVRVPIIGTDGIASSSMLEGAGLEEAMLGVMGTAPTITGTDEFNTAFKAEYGYDPTIFVPETYDATTIMAKAILEADSVDGDDVKAAIKTVGTNYQGVSGTITFDDNGDILGGTYVIWQFLKDDQGKTTLETVGSWSGGTLTLNDNFSTPQFGGGGGFLPLDIFAMLTVLFAVPALVLYRRKK